jgi:hypothetical protein
MTLLELNPADFRRFLTVLVDRCLLRPDEGLETQKYSLYPKEHPANCPLRWRLSNGLGVYLSDAMLLPTDENFAQEVPEPVYDGLTCPKYALWDSNLGTWLAKEQKMRRRA